MTRYVQLVDATIRFADRTVLREITLALAADDRFAIVGDNGAGKSTLLGMLSGTVELASGERTGSVEGGIALAEQHPEFPEGCTVRGALDALLADIRSLERAIREQSEALSMIDPKLEEAALHRALHTLGDLVDRFEARDGYTLDTRLDAALEQLGLGTVDRNRPVSSLSGGERARLGLAAAVSSHAELLLLDEPTNDLDDAGVSWLEQRLSAYRGAIVAVSHDRAFLHGFAHDVLHVEDGGVRRYGNGYHGYLLARARERRRLLEEHVAWKHELARNTELVEANAFRLHAIPRKRERAVFGHGAFRARGRDHGAMSRIRQAKERVDRLLAEPAAKPADPLQFAPGFTQASVDQEPPEHPEAVITACGVSNAPHQPGIELAELEVFAGDRWLITGANGAGKTTLLRVLAREIETARGTVSHREGLRVSWVRQNLASSSSNTLLVEFSRALTQDLDDAEDTLLSLGVFPPHDLEIPVRELSVGQQRRLELAIAVSRPSDVLFLDEPTNHLSPELVEQLEDALSDYEGAVLTVTHDRRWRERTTEDPRTRRIHVNSGGVVQS